MAKGFVWLLFSTNNDRIWIFNTKLNLARIPYVSSDWGPLQEKFENFYLTFSISLSAIAVQVNR